MFFWKNDYLNSASNPKLTLALLFLPYLCPILGAGFSPPCTHLYLYAIAALQDPARWRTS